MSNRNDIEETSAKYPWRCNFGSGCKRRALDLRCLKVDLLMKSLRYKQNIQVALYCHANLALLIISETFL